MTYRYRVGDLVTELDSVDPAYRMQGKVLQVTVADEILVLWENGSELWEIPADVYLDNECEIPL